MNEYPSLVVFDLAGTTVEDNGEVPRAFADAFTVHGIRITADQIDAVRGSSKREAVVKLIPEGCDRQATASLIYEDFKQRLSDLYRDSVKPVEGAAEVFRWLKHRNVLVALNTGFDRDITELLLDQLNWKVHTFDAIVCGDDVSKGRPAPDLILLAMKLCGIFEASQVANVGDTEIDLRAAQNAGVRWNIGVSSGAHNRAQLQALPHTHLLNSVNDLVDLWPQ